MSSHQLLLVNAQMVNAETNEVTDVDAGKTRKFSTLFASNKTLTNYVTSIRELLEPHNYFEVTIKEVSKFGAVTIGAIFPGFKKPRFSDLYYFGYHSDGSVFFNGVESQTKAPAYGVGDVVGFAVQNQPPPQVVFTLNGQIVGEVSRYYANLVPLVSMPGSRVSLNFGERPFAFDANKAAPEPKSTQIASTDPLFNMFPFLDGVTLARAIQVCKLWNSWDDDKLWEKVTMVRWPFLARPPTGNWKQFFGQRHKRVVVKQNRGRQGDVLSTENCNNWKFKCPRDTLKLVVISESYGTCLQCQQSVFFVADMEDLAHRAQQGQCVALDFDGSLRKQVKAQLKKNEKDEHSFFRRFKQTDLGTAKWNGLYQPPSEQRNSLFHGS